MLLTKKQIKRYSRQIILKKIGPIGQKKLINSSVLVIGAGGLGSPILMYLAGLGVGNIGVVDHDKVDLSNLHRQILFDVNDLKKEKSKIASIKIGKINPDVKVNYFQKKLTKKNINKMANNFNILIDGSDNFKTKFLLNDYSIKNKKILISGAINKFDGQVFTFNFKNLLNCEADGVIGPIAGITGSIQANEFVKETLKIGKSLCGYILIVNAFNLEFRKIKLNKRKKCICNRN